MAEDNQTPAEEDKLLGVKYSKLPLPFCPPPGCECPAFYEKQDVENYHQLQDIQNRNKHIAAELVHGDSHMNQAERAFDLYAHRLSDHVDAIMKEKAKGSVWERLSFVTQITLVGLVALQVFRGGKWVLERVWEKLKEVEDEQRRQQQLHRSQQGGKRNHAREIQIRYERLAED